jgi:hypothetical protein
MDGTAAISRNLEALKRILAGLVAMAGLGCLSSPLTGEDGSARRGNLSAEAQRAKAEAEPLAEPGEGSGSRPTLPRHLRLAIFAAAAAGRIRRASADHRVGQGPRRGPAAAAQAQAEACHRGATAPPFRHRRRSVARRPRQRRQDPPPFTGEGDRRRRWRGRPPTHLDASPLRSSAPRSCQRLPPQRAGTRRSTHPVSRRHQAVFSPVAALARRPGRRHASDLAPRRTRRGTQRPARTGKTLRPLEGSAGGCRRRAKGKP